MVSRLAGVLCLAGTTGAWAMLAPQAPRRHEFVGAPPEERAGVVEAWRVAGAGRGTPAVDDGAVYALSRWGELLALERGSGRLRWRQPTSPPGTETAGSAVRLWRGLAIAGDDTILAFDATTGAPVWSVSPEEAGGAGHYLGAVVDGLVVAGSSAGYVLGIDAATGRRRWRAGPGDQEPTTVYEPAAAAGLVVAAFNVFTAPVSGGVLAVDAIDGRERWRQPLVSADGSPFTNGWGGGLLVDGDLVVVSGRDGRMWGLSLLDGRPRWRIDPERDAGGVPAGRPDVRPLTRSGRLVIAGSTTGRVTAFDLDSRAVKWRYTDERLGSTAFRLASDERLAYVPFFSGRLVALDVRTGVEHWRLGGAERELVWAPALDRRWLFLTSSSGYLAYSR